MLIENMLTKQVYYLLSQFDVEEETMSEYKFVDLSHMKNFFEVIQLENNVYLIIKIYKNNSNGKFKINDKIFFDGGMISFYTKNNNGEIDQIECFSTVLIEKEKIKLFNETIDTKIDELIKLINKYEDEVKNEYGDNLINQNYIEIKNTLENFSNFSN
jgi:hypothetical protein